MFPDIPRELYGAEVQSTSTFRVLVKSDDNGDVLIQVDRAKMGGAPASRIRLSESEADALLIALMNEIG